MRRAIVITATLMLSTVGAEAGFSSMGAGAGSCAEFNRQYAKTPAAAETVFFSWAQGFLSGVNQILMYQHARTKNLQSLSLDDQRARLRAYCTAHPNAIYQLAVMNLFVALGANPPAAAPPPKQ